MKFNIRRASIFSNKVKTIELKTIEDITKLIKKEGRIVIEEKNDSLEEDYPHSHTVIIYDDYLE